jgi:hypothetical protein
VDDILPFADDEEINRVETFMKKEFQWITVIKNNTQSYLGMNITVEKNLVTVDMNYFMQQLLMEFTGDQTVWRCPRHLAAARTSEFHSAAARSQAYQMLQQKATTSMNIFPRRSHLTYRS